jgi:tRNA-2-methylthio-N6-dimethylallyladenosine synthase
MRRGYSSEETRNALVELRERAPRLTLITHVLIGFPGESDADFNETLEILRAVRFDRVDAYLYSDRPNTSASLLPCKVARTVKEARCALLLAEFPTHVPSYV